MISGTSPPWLSTVPFMQCRHARMRPRTDETGATAVEYALMAGLVAVVIAGAVALIAPQLIPWFLVAAAAV